MRVLLSQVLSELEHELARVTAAGPSAAPAATKFAFGRRKAALASPAAPAPAAAPAVAPPMDHSIASASTPHAHRAPASVSPGSASRPASTYSDLQNTVIDLRDMQLSVLFLSRLRHCIVLAPNVSASVLIRDAESSIFWLGCHQVRTPHRHLLQKRSDQRALAFRLPRSSSACTMP